MINIFVAGHVGMVGSAIMRQLYEMKNVNIITRTRQELDLTHQAEVFDFFQNTVIDQVYLAAAKVGGILANNTYPADFIYDNLSIQNNVIQSAHRTGVQSLLFLGSSCIYPKEAPQPMSEEALLTGKLEPTNEPYAIAKIAGIKMCESYNRQHNRDYRSVMPTNLYGVGDNFHPENSHVIPALIRRFHEAVKMKSKSVTIWGSGRPMREFLYVDDMARACTHIMGLKKGDYDNLVKPQNSHINVGTGTDCSIAELALTISNVTGFEGEIKFDHSKPDGPVRKLMDVSVIKGTGWRPKVSLKDGLKTTYQWYLQNLAAASNL